MKFYVRAITPNGERALQKHLEDTEKLAPDEKIKGKAVVKHKVVSDRPLTVMMRPRKPVVWAARITPGLHKFVEDYKEQMRKVMRENGAQEDDYELWVEGRR